MPKSQFNAVLPTELRQAFQIALARMALQGDGDHDVILEALSARFSPEKIETLFLRVILLMVTVEDERSTLYIEDSKPPLYIPELAPVIFEAAAEMPIWVGVSPDDLLAEVSKRSRANALMR